METAVIFALGAFGTWAASQQVLANQMDSNPSMSQVYTRGATSEKLSLDVEDPRRKNAFTSSDGWKLIDRDNYNALKVNRSDPPSRREGQRGSAGGRSGRGDRGGSR